MHQRLAWMRMAGTIQDFRHAVRSLRATPTFTAVALIVLALGIGVTTAVFSVVDGVVLRGEFNTWVLALFGILAVAIAGAGIYGVMAYIVEQRTQEIGVRIALGAEPAAVIRMVLSQASACIGAGLGLGLISGWMLSRSVQAFLFKIDAHDPRVYAGAAAVLIVAGLAAAFIPARRAARVDPMIALRAQ